MKRTPKTVYALFKQGAKRWARRDLAKDANGVYVQFQSNRAESFCLLGAIYRVYGLYNNRSERAKAKLRRVIGWPIGAWNDGIDRTFEQVLAAVKKAKI